MAIILRRCAHPRTERTTFRQLGRCITAEDAAQIGVTRGPDDRISGVSRAIAAKSIEVHRAVSRELTTTTRLPAYRARSVHRTSGILYQMPKAAARSPSEGLSAERYHCDAIAEADSVVLALPKANLLAALGADPAHSLKLALALAGQVRDLRARLELRNIRSASERVLAWLHQHARGDPPTVGLTGSWTDIAGELGLSREAVYRALAGLEMMGKINRGPGLVRLLVLDKPKRMQPHVNSG